MSEPFNGHIDSVTSVIFSPDDKHVISGSSDSTIRIWSVETGQAGAESFYLDQAQIEEDGWIRGPSKELVFWVPELHREGFHRPSNVHVIGCRQTRIDTRDTAYGEGWTTCYTPLVRYRSHQLTLLTVLK